MQKCNSKLKFFYFLLVFITFISLETSLLIFALLTLNLSPARAFTMSNNNYILKMGNLNTAAGSASGEDHKLGITVGQTAPGLYTGTNYKVRAGFQYIHLAGIPFVFTVSETLIDFGTLSPTNPVTRTNTLTVSNGSANGYAVLTFENHPLRAPNGAVIPDTTCDNGSCSETSSSAWTNILTYGFGYRCDNVSGSECASGFTDKTSYKQFADESKNETPQATMKGTKGRNLKAQITYKVNVSGVQAAGEYSNIITYIATPTF